MTAQWTLNVWANLIEYNNASLGCHDAQCAIDKINEMLRQFLPKKGNSYLLFKKINVVDKLKK